MQVVAPTGCGKTMIAALVISDFLQKHPCQKVIFIAQTNPLVIQQTGAILRRCRPYDLAGGIKGPRVTAVGVFDAGGTSAKWADLIDAWDVIICTPKYLQVGARVRFILGFGCLQNR